jgi:general secretion pathway protein E
MMKSFKDKIVKILFTEGVLNEDMIKNIRSKETAQRGKLLKIQSDNDERGQYISIVDVIASLELTLPGKSNKKLTEELIMEVVARHLNIPYVKIDPLKLDSDVVTGIISRPFALKHTLLPIKVSDRNLTLAVANPFDGEAIDWIERTTNYKVTKVISTKTDILKIITEFYGFRTSVTAAHKDIEARHDISNLEQLVQLKSLKELESTDKHIVNAVEYLLHYAYSQRASDIHIEPKRDSSIVRFRIDGILHEINRMPRNVHPAIVSRIKTLARLDIAEKRRPQDGRIKTEQGGTEIELRISTLAVAFGEKVVIRIFDPNILMRNLSELGFPPRELKIFKHFLASPHGIILVTGPTGSGKTTTLYSALKTLSTQDVNVTSIEDPIEMVCEEFNQTAVQPQIGITFASTLRTLLRQDPDIIMVGEIRDTETAENAVQASLTGHLVLSTLHTNDAPTSITRLLDLGLPPFLINPTLLGIVAQRLVRKVCKNCAQPRLIKPHECILLGLKYERVCDLTVFEGKGCPECRGTGYYGRTGAYEILEMNEEIRHAVSNRVSPSDIRKQAIKDGMILLRDAALRKMFSGITTLEEVIRVTGSVKTLAHEEAVTDR